MIISQLRKFTPANILIVCLVGALLCLGILFNLPSTQAVQPIFLEPTLNNLLHIGIGLPIQHNILIALIITLLQAFFLNTVINNYNFFTKPNFLSALTYITLVSAFLPFLILSPPLICNFIAIWMLNKLFNIYKQSDVKGLMYDLGIIVAIGSLIYFPFIIMLFLLWIALLVFRPFYWREWVTPLLGFVNVYFLIGVIYFWLGRLEEFEKIFSALIIHPKTNLLPIDQNDYIVLIPIGLALLLFLAVLKDHYFRSVVHIRKSFQLLFYMVVLVFVSSFLSDSINHFLLCVPPLAIYLAYYFTYAKVKWLYESLFVIIIATILYLQVI